MSEHPTSPQINILQDGRVTTGEYPDPAMQATIETQSELRDKKRDISKTIFQETVDSSNLNNNYHDALALTEKYFANEGLEIAPLRVVDRDTLQRAYKAAGQSDSGQEEGRSVNGRALIVDNPELGKLFGDDFVLGIALHEAAHSTNGSDEKLIHIVRQHNNGAGLGGIAINERSFGKADLRKGTEYKVTGDFWEEAFADLTRVRALRALGRVHDLTGNSKPFEPVEGITMVTVPNGTSVDQPNVISFPAEFTLCAKTLGDDNWSVKGASDYAAYALELLDNHTPGLYEDLKAARTNPTRQKDAIQKIESVRPGLYRELRDLEYNVHDFVLGLTTVLEALAEREQPES